MGKGEGRGNRDVKLFVFLCLASTVVYFVSPVGGKSNTVISSDQAVMRLSPAFVSVPNR